VELDELHIHEPAARVQRHAHAIAVVLVATRRTPTPDARVTARREDDGVREVDGSLARVKIEGERTEASPVGHQQPRDVLVLFNADAELGGLGGDRAHDRPSREVAGEAGSSPAVGAKVALVQAAVLGARELAPPGCELCYGVR